MKQFPEKGVKAHQNSGSAYAAGETACRSSRKAADARPNPVIYPFARAKQKRAVAPAIAESRPDSRFEIANCLDLDFLEEIRKDIRRGLTAPQKSIPSKYFYDARGSRLFDQICQLPEYYPTRTEISILRSSAPQIMSFFSHRKADLVEIGCGSDIKIRKLLDGTDPPLVGHIRYVPVDISAKSLLQSSDRLLKDYRALKIFGIIADFTRHLELMPQGRKLIAFLGGTFGNFTDSESISLLKRFAAVMNFDDRLLLGLDMLKPVDIIEAAYNDSAGITAQFNLNILNHINRRLGADFDTAYFEHRAFFNRHPERIEMHLAAKKDLNVRIADLNMTVLIEKGETIHTENSQKFSRRSAMERFREAGLYPGAWHTDEKGWFSLVELQTSPAG